MDKIYNLYNKSTYLDKYGGSFVLTVFFILIFFIIFSWFFVKSHTNKINQNWAKYRCDPRILPFAGLIHSDPKLSRFEFTAKNFEGCTYDILTKVASYAFEPIYYAIQISLNFFKELLDALSKVRQMLNYIRTSVDKVGSEIFTRFYNSLLPIIKMIIHLRDTAAKTNGVLTTSIFTLFSGYLTLKTFIGAMIEVVVLILTLFAGLIAGLWILPFTYPLAGTLTLAWVAVATPFAIVDHEVSKIFKTKSKNMPSRPHK